MKFFTKINKTIFLVVLFFGFLLSVVSAQIGPPPPPIAVPPSTATPIITTTGVSLPPTTSITSTSYGKTKDTIHAFELVFDPDMWAKTDKSSFIASGEIKAFVYTTPSLAIAYGAENNKLTNIAPTTKPNNAFLGITLNANDVQPFTSSKVTVTSIEKDIKNNIVYFAIVDAKNPDIAYTDVQSIELGANTGATSYGLQQSAGTSADVPDDAPTGGLLDGICSDVHTCGFNDLLKLVTSFWKFIVYLIIPLVAFMTAWIGYNFMQSGAEYREKAKEMSLNMLKGILLVLFAWFIVNTILNFVLFGGEASCYTFLGKGDVDPACLDKSK